MRTLLLILTILFFSCNDKTSKNTEATTEVPVSTMGTSDKENKNSTYLCKINGEDWFYTEASGLVFTEKKTAVKKAVITFKKQLEKGSESIQVEYNLENNTLVRVLVTIKKPDKHGKPISAHYTATEDSVATNQIIIWSGSITLSNQSTASGTASFNVENRYEKTVLKNSEDLIIQVSDLQFSGVAYSDLNKSFGN